MNMDTNKVNYEQKRWNNKEMLLNINMQSKCLKRVLFLATRSGGFNKFIYFERVNFKHIYITMSVHEH